MSRNLCLKLCIVQLLWMFVHGTGHYSVVGPGTIRSHTKYNVAVAVHKTEAPCQIKVGITGPSYNETKTVDLQPMSMENVQFDLPKLSRGDYNLTAVGVAGIIFENSTKLNFDDYKPSIFVQTDKATYKPGDLVQFRVLFLDENTRPAKIQQPITILISDGSQNLIKQLTAVQLTGGVFTGKLQLSEQPVLGNWLIDVQIGGENVANKPFEVAKYVLPKFDVTIETAPNIAIADGIIKVTVRSKYTYGKSVKGKATVSLQPTYHYYGNSDNDLVAEKTIDVDGKGHLEFDLTKDLHLAANSYMPPLKITAVMEEALTGNKQNSSTTVTIHTERYRIVGIDLPHTFMPGKPITIQVVVKNLDGSPVRDAKTPAKLIAKPPLTYFSRDSLLKEVPDESTLSWEANLNEHGMATFEFTLPDDKSYYSLSCKYADTNTYLSSLSKFTEQPHEHVPLKITVNTEKPRLGKDISVEVTSDSIIPYFIYTIVGRGNILKTEYVDVPNGRQSHTFKIQPVFEMIPKAKLFIHYVYDNDLRFEEKNIEFEKAFENTIDIEAPVQAKPGEEVKLTVKTDAGSLVGLLGVDQSVLLLKSGNDIKKDDVFSSLDKYDTNTPWFEGYGRYPGEKSGVITMTNANYPYMKGFRKYPFYLMGPPRPMAFGYVGAPGVPGMPLSTLNRVVPTKKETAVPQLRKEFPENWIFFDQENSDVDGFSLVKKIPDTITSWVITGFSLNPKTGLALTDDPTKVQVFQPFFISTNLPYSVKRGEVIAIPVIIFNYMDKALDAEITMDNTDKEYDFTEASNEVDEKSIDEVQRVKRITIPSNTGKSVSFMIRPKKVGQTTLKITAVTPLAGDAIHQTLKVEAEGVTQYENRAIFVNLNDKSEQSEKLSIDIPSEAVKDSEYIEIAAVGDLLGPTVKNLDKLVRMPYGCGEQNMVNFVPNILVLKYLQTIKKEMPTVTERAQKFLEIGYQRELTYKHDDGSYSAFGKSDKAGSTWLTAYVARSFHQAAKFTDIDPKIIVEALDFLASKQAENGSFPEYGKLFDSAHQNELGLTSYVLLAFFENTELISKYQEQIDNGLKFVVENIASSNDSYSLAIAASLLQKAKHGAADKVIDRLNGFAKQDDTFKWWPKSEDKSEYSYHPRSVGVEITAYALLAFLEKESAEVALPIAKWLISKRNSNGGFSSTQDTVVGLQALIKFAEKTAAGSAEMDIDFAATGEGADDKGNIKLNPENSLVLQTHVLPKATRQVEFTAKGKGTSMVQLSYRYNLADKDKQPSFKVTTNVRENTGPEVLILEVCSEFVPLEDKKESNMAVMEINLPSGYTAESESFGQIEAVEGVKRTETKNSDSAVIVYFDGLTVGNVKCIPIEASRSHAVAKQKPAAVSMYDYYETDRRATEFYEVKSSLCDICEGDDCGAGCMKQ